MTQKNIISPFEGEPQTWSKTDEHGNPVMTVKICEMTPERVPWADGLAIFCTFTLIALSFYFLPETEPSHFWAWLGGMTALLFLHSWFVKYFYKIMVKETLAMFTPKEFRIKTKSGWRHYDRTLTHRFVMMKHDRTREERERHDLKIRGAQRNGRDIQPKSIYSDSFHIIFEYLGQRIDVATVYKQARATAVAARMKACDKVMDTANKMGEGEVLNPGEQWGSAPGKLPDV